MFSKAQVLSYLAICIAFSDEGRNFIFAFSKQFFSLKVLYIEGCGGGKGVQNRLQLTSCCPSVTVVYNANAFAECLDRCRSTEHTFCPRSKRIYHEIFTVGFEQQNCSRYRRTLAELA